MIAFYNECLWNRSFTLSRVSLETKNKQNYEKYRKESAVDGIKILTHDNIYENVDNNFHKFSLEFEKLFSFVSRVGRKYNIWFDII